MSSKEDKVEHKIYVWTTPLRRQEQRSIEDLFETNEDPFRSIEDPFRATRRPFCASEELEMTVLEFDRGISRQA